LRTHLIRSALPALALSVIAGSAVGQTPKPAKAIKWAPSFNAAMASAKSSNKLVMIDFYTEW
jgi:hypothetical protein